MIRKYFEKIIILQVMDSHNQTSKITKGLDTSATSMVLENLVTTSKDLGNPVNAMKYLRVTDKTTMAIFTLVVFDLFQIHIVIAFAFVIDHYQSHIDHYLGCHICPVTVDCIGSIGSPYYIKVAQAAKANNPSYYN